MTGDVNALIDTVELFIEELIAVYGRALFVLACIIVGLVWAYLHFGRDSPVEINPEELKRRYEELSDEGLLSIDRKDLTELARTYYDAGVARRGLHSHSGPP